MRSMILSFMLLWALPASGSSPAAQEKAEEQKLLAQILEKTVLYTEQVKSAVMAYSCGETLSETSFRYKAAKSKDKDGAAVAEIKLKKKKTATYHFKYMMEHGEAKLAEKRVAADAKSSLAQGHDLPLGPGGDAQDTFRVSRGVDKTATFSMRLQYLVYMPVVFLGRYGQYCSSFQIQGEEELDGKKAWIVSTAPKATCQDMKYRGKTWIAAGDFAVLKIEYEPIAPESYPVFVSFPVPGYTRRISGAIHFGLVKNGIRFPSREIFRDSYVGPDGREYPVLTVEIDFKNYLVSVQ